MSTYTVVTILVAISAFFSYLNARFLKISGTIGIVTIATIASVFLLVFGKSIPSLNRFIITLTDHIDFSDMLLDTMLGFLLFAGSLNFDINLLKGQMKPVLILSTVGVILSTGIFGGLFYAASLMLHIEVPLVYCLLFGALISPTDPVAVSSILKKSKIPKHLETIITGESLFNDGIGLVLFITLSQLARQRVPHVSFAHVATLFATEVFGGLILGLLMALLVYRLMKAVEDFQTIIILSLALVMSLTVLCALFHFSGPLSVVTAGLYIGSQHLTSDEQGGRTRQYMERFWKLIDELLNTVLFVMIGLQLIKLPFVDDYWQSGLVAIVLIIIARGLSVLLPVALLQRTLDVNYKSVFILTWAGLRGGISVALALSLHESKYKELIIASCYFVVIFSIIFQGLTLNNVIKYTLRKKTEA
ncbi:cation:proton antiporter [Mucilaginibacter paludis]|uniref:Sodium/hydrogen exchanger n=1 Tax=Mucilaginibacter paludis DSM 18603 TaxID=714943 RepID=H1Y5D4_9SPHI|nr:sodium:proton antiporter [Mucilaginibacter paludis]EHQ28945.1 sodium/hydrogen exchanger [Mucilaginibacter paludis DSM 18603]